MRISVRITMLRSMAPSKSNSPIAPENTPRSVGSRRLMIFMASIFGAPVIEPPGKQARSSSTGPSSSRSSARMVETICQVNS